MDASTEWVIVHDAVLIDGRYRVTGPYPTREEAVAEANRPCHLLDGDPCYVRPLADMDGKMWPLDPPAGATTAAEASDTQPEQGPITLRLGYAVRLSAEEAKETADLIDRLRGERDEARNELGERMDSAAVHYGDVIRALTADRDTARTALAEAETRIEYLERKLHHP